MILQLLQKLLQHMQNNCCENYTSSGAKSISQLQIKLQQLQKQHKNLRLLGKETLPAGAYPDTKDNWARDAIQAMTEAGILSGYGR